MISILMSTHNPIQEYLNKCLDSMFRQSYQNFELVLVDDGSDKKVIDLIDKNKYDISKIKYVRLDKNVGLPSALNIGLEYCNGEYIARMDDDDIMAPNRLEDQLKLVESENLIGSFSWYETINGNDEIINQNKILLSSDQFLKQLIIKGNIFCHSSLFIKKDILKKVGGYDKNLTYAQDSELYIRLLSVGKMGMVEKYLIQHRVNELRNNKYRETLSLTYALFGAMNFYTKKGNLKLKDKIFLLIRLLRYYVGIVRINKKGEKKK